MASTSSTIRIIFDGAVDGLRRAARQAENDLNGFNRETDRLNRGLTRIFTTGTKATAALGTVGSAVPLMAGLATSATTAAGALLVLPGAALSAGAAVTVLKLATAGFGEAVTAADPKAFAEATKEMGSSAIETATAVRSMRPEFVGLKKDVQNAFFKDFATDAKLLGGTYLPVLRPQLTGIASNFNAMGREAVKALVAPAAVKDVNTVLGDTNKITADLKPALGNVLTGILAIAGQGSAEFKGFGAVITDATTRFKDWARQAADSGRITELIREGKEELRAWGEVGSNVGSILGTIFDGITDDQGNFADSLVETTAQLDAFLKTAEGQDALKALGDTLRVTGEVVRDVLMAALEELGPIITAAAPAAQEFATVLGGLLVGAIRTVGPLIQQFAQFLSENKEAIGTLLPLLSALVLGFGALRIITSIVGWTAGALAALRGFGTFLLGPWGLALTGAALALGIFIAKQRDAAEAAREHEGAVASLKSTLDQYTGAVTEATKAHVAEDLAGRKLADGTTLLRDVLREAGISFQDYTEAATGNEEAIGRVNAKLGEHLKTLPEVRELYDSQNQGLSRLGITFEEFIGFLARGEQGYDALRKRIAEAGGMFSFSNEHLKETAGRFGELGSVLGEYNGALKEAQEQTRLAAGISKTFSDVLDTIKLGLGGLKDGAAPLSTMVTAFRALGESAQVSALAAGKAAAELGGVDEGAKKARESMQASRQAFLDAAAAAGIAAPQAERLADEIGLIPEAAETQFRTNATGVKAEILELAERIKATPDAKTFTLNSNSPELIKQLEELGFKVKSLPNGQLEITLEDENARRKLEAFTKTISTLHAAPKLDLETSTAQQKADAMKAHIDGLVGIAKADADAAPGTDKANKLKEYIDGITGILTADANPAPGTEKANQLQAYISGLVGILTADADNAPGKAKGDALREYIDQLLGIMTADADTRPGKEQADALKRYTDNLRGVIKVSADVSSAESSINNAARPRSTTITVNVRYNDPGPPVRVAGGGVLGYSGGGFVPLRRFAHGGVISGYAPGRDTVPALLSRGEAVLVPELVRAIGARYILAANKAASGRQPTYFTSGGVARFAAGGLAAARSYLIAGLAANGGGATQPPVMTQLPETAVNVRVFLGDREIRDVVRTEIDTKSRDVARTVRAGAGVSW